MSTAKTFQFFRKFYSINLVNLVFQRIFRIDSDCPYPKNFTSRVLCGSKLKIQDNSRDVLRSLAVSGGCYIHAAHGINIGKGTIWSFNVAIVSLDHSIYNLSEPATKGPITIGADCWIGAGAVILSGVTLGDRTIVGANSVVTKSFPAGNVIIAGNPAKIIRNI